MSGRISSLDAVTMPDGKLALWVGAASGGVWKSLDGGTTFTPVFDDQPVQSIGAVEIDKRNTETVWVGTGEAWTRNSVSIGNGIYKTTDGGDTWQHLGSPAPSASATSASTRAPATPCIACVTGPLVERFARARRLQDHATAARPGSRCCKAPNASTGCASLSMDEKNPGHALRRAVGFPPQGLDVPLRRRIADGTVGQRADGHRDGGHTWTEVTPEKNKGFAQKPYGRIAVNVAPSDSQRVYAFVESPQSALYVSDDGGATWEARDRSQWMVWRPFYFARMTVDPNNADRVFKDDGDLILSEDAGRSFSVVGGFDGMHGDIHDVWVNPTNSKHVIVGRRRRPVAEPRRRQQVVEGREPADLAVLPRERRRRGSVPRLRRPAGQQQLDRRFGLSRRHHQQPLGKHVRRRRLLDVLRPGRPRLPLRGIPGRRHRAREQAHARDARHPAEGARRREAALQLEHAAAPVAQREGHALHRRAVPVPHARPGPDVGPHLAGPHDQRSAEAAPGRNGRRHGGQLRRRDAHHDLLDQRIAAGGGHDLGRHRRRQRAAHARRRQELDERHRQPQGRAEGVVGELGRGEPARRGHGLRDVRPPHLRRPRPVGLRHARLRQELATAGHAAGRTRHPRLRARHQGRCAAAEPAVPRHGIRALDLDRRRPVVGRVQGRQVPGGRGARPRRSSRATTTSSSPPTAAASGSSTTSRRCAR